MSTITEYFTKNAYTPKYYIGDRLFGKWKGIPFVGTVGNDRNKVGDENNPEIVVHLDLPIILEETIYYVIIVKHKDVKPLKIFEL